MTSRLVIHDDDLVQMGAEADRNFFALAANSYPGRGFAIGRAENPDLLVQVYWTMGRSADSRNRVLSYEEEEGRVFTELANPAAYKGTDEQLGLLLYNAMLERDSVYVVSNGVQTDTVLNVMEDGDELQVALQDFEYENDPPNFTPRITAVTVLNARHLSLPSFNIGVLRRTMMGGMDHEQDLFLREKIFPGFALSVTTYQGDGKPLPAFRGEPLVMPLRGGIEEIAETYWAALNEMNRVSLAVKMIDIHTHNSEVKIINKYQKVA